MRVDLCWKDDETPEGKIRVVHNFQTKEEAKEYFRVNLENKVKLAYLKRFVEWSDYIIEILYDPEGKLRKGRIG